MFRLLFVLMMFVSVVNAETVVEANDGDEIRVVVPFVKNLDKKIIFEEPVAIGATGAFKNVIRTQSIGNTVYFTAKTTSDRRFRIVGKGQQSKKVYTLLVSVSERADDVDAIRVVSPGKAFGLTRSAGKSEVTPIELVRFVSQTLFSPSYAIEPLSGVRMVGHSLPDDLDFLYEGASLDISPIRAYRAGKWTVTALKVTNKSQFEEHSLTPDGLMKIYPRVNAEGVVSQHKYLGISKDDNSSVIYIVTQGALAKNLKVGV